MKAIIVVGSIVSMFSISASADTLYYVYKVNGVGNLGLGYETVQECELEKNRPCVLSEVICGGYKVAFTKTSYSNLKAHAKSWEGEWRLSVSKDPGNVSKKYDEAEESNFEIKLCEQEEQPRTISQEGASQGKTLAEEISALVELHNLGALTDEEFSAAKSKVINKR